MTEPRITDTLLAWHDQHGRTNLPWQNTRDAYRIWVSEIMLQQTQVTTVIPYYERFMQRFPNASALAEADIDDVLHLWTGLGYYARARNLHKAAKQIIDEHNGKFPTEFEEVLTLSGIGRSTAGAILAFSEQQRHPILDGNVKRVLSRVYAVEGWYGKKPVENRLWELAELNTPGTKVDQYTQAIMDFGATLCTRTKPNCNACPLTDQCQALEHDRVNELPHGKPKTDKPTKHTYMLLIEDDDGGFLLEQRPPSGIWGGLWCPIEIEEHKTTAQVGALKVTIQESLPSFRHTFSHYFLDITPLKAVITGQAQIVAENTNLVWYNPASPKALGLPAPVKKLLEQVAN